MSDLKPPFDRSSFLQHLTMEPGVYRMLDSEGRVLYVGKARHLKQRVSSYFKTQVVEAKTKSLVSQIHSIEITVTRSETEALLLESNFIKSLRPKYNVLMRDDKSYPFIHISDNHPFPRLEIKRCKKKPESGHFFGPYPSVTAVHETVQMIQKVFKIRNCSDTTFASRSRPCLQYQIKRCSAPCTQYISSFEYEQSVLDAMHFLAGKCQLILDELASRMDDAVQRLAFEEAAILRDQIKKLRLVQEQQSVVQQHGDADVIVIEARRGFACIQCITVREGEVIASPHFFPSVPKESLVDDNEAVWQQVFAAFVAYYYLECPERIPALIITDHAIDDHDALQQLLKQVRGMACRIQIKPTTATSRWIAFARNNLQQAIAAHMASVAVMTLRYKALCELIHRDKPIQRMECFDISHTQGQDTVASCVVFDAHGPSKRNYRRFNISGITPGDDYAAMEQAIMRRFKRLLLASRLPDILIVDGGQGQWNVAQGVLDSLEISTVTLIGIAKGPDRKAGWEHLIVKNFLQPITLSVDSPALHLLQQIRDEAHRFAITTHRKKRQASGFDSSLEHIPGIGSKRRQALLRRFGGIRELSKAPLDEILKVRGISFALAESIYKHFHP